MMNLIGKMLDNRYEILEKIGVGGMATVYKAKCHVLNRFVAIKILKDEFTTDSDFIRRFNTEAQAAASLTHPNIVSIYDVGNEDNLYYIVMELIQGKTLKEIITEDGKLSWKWSVNIAIQIASALEVAHKNNIIHRDIKPHNIIITEDGIAKVTDFGIAKAVSNSTITAFGTTIGSVHYFSPEHARGGYTDAKSDLYSLGVVMYEMVTGRVPFDADTPVSVALKQVQEEPVDPITYAKDLPVSVNRIILKAMQKDPNLRYQNATEMLKDLSMALKRPNEDFVVLALKDDDSPTQKIPTIYELDMERNNDRNAPKIGEGESEKKKGKLAKIKEFYEKHRFLKFLTILVILGIIFLIVGLITVGIINGSRTEQAYLPEEVTSLDLEAEDQLTGEEIKTILENAGFTNVKIENESSDTVEAGYIIKIEPNKANYLYNLDQEIIITVSTGPEIGVLPTQMVGKQRSEVEAELKELGFVNLNITEETSETVEEGIVLSVDPLEGEEIAKNTTINIVVSSGSQFETVTVKSVIGETEANAKTILSAISENLVVEVNYEEDLSKDDGVVISQTVDGKALDSGETVDVKENVTVSLVVNKLPVESTVTFNINVASYYPEAQDSDSSDEDGNSVNNTSTSPAVSKIPVLIYVGGIQVSNENVNTDTTSYTKTYKTSGSKEVIITVGGNQVYHDNINFSSGDQTITISK